MSDNVIGVNSKGLDRDIILGKEIGSGFGKGQEARQKAIDAAAANEGSELVYEKDDGWHVAEVRQEGRISGAGSLSKTDSADITINNEKLGKLGIKASTISFAEDDFNSLAQGETEDKIKVAGNPAAPPELIRSLANHKYFSVREAVAANPAAPPETILALASDKDYRVRVAVASNPATAPDVLDLLARDGLHEKQPNPFLFKIQQAAAANPSTPPETLKEMYKTGNFNEELAKNPATPNEILKKIK